MKSDSERKKHYNAKLHQKKSYLHVHLSKELRQKMKSKKRSILLKKGDQVKVMRGSLKGKSGKVARVDYNRSKVFIEGLTRKNLRGRDILVPIDPSNLLLTQVDMNEIRKELFTQEDKQPSKS
ncbi:50S ribosomal protein L24 [Candidatus Micrarchaeota archaeon]|nr:50S ribosomal protein L24 [Candidatus Micrarchaeota archaeon]